YRPSTGWTAARPPRRRSTAWDAGRSTSSGRRRSARSRYSLGGCHPWVSGLSGTWVDGDVGPRLLRQLPDGLDVGGPANVVGGGKVLFGHLGQLGLEVRGDPGRCAALSGSLGGLVAGHLLR